MRLTPFAKLFITFVIVAVLAYVFWTHGNPLRRSSAAPRAASSDDQPVEAAKIVLRLTGSNTIGAELAPALAEAFLRKQGAQHIARETDSTAEEITIVGVLPGTTTPSAIHVSAHGSSEAFKALDGDTADIGMSSRRATADETVRLRDRGLGDIASTAGEHVIALDGIAVITHRANVVRSLTHTQLRGLFSGDIADWSQVGGQTGPVVVYTRDSKSGTSEMFRALVMAGRAFATSTRSFEDSRELSHAVATDPHGIGFVGLPYIGDARAVPVGDDGTEPLLPTYLTVATEDYFLARRLYFYTSSTPSNGLTSAFVEFAQSADGQAVVQKTGFVEQRPERTSKTESDPAAMMSDDAPPEYRRLVQGAERLSVNFRFRSGSTDLDTKAVRDLQRVADVLSMSEFRNRALLLLGFADSRGSAAVNLRLSSERANVVAHELATYGAKPQTVRGFGSLKPVASNDSDEGREKNRRVEVWLR